jgi:sugar lactone lactonase YvrE
MKASRNLASVLTAVAIILLFVPALSFGLMGGAVQGSDLDLTTGNADVTTLAGSGENGTSDGTGSAARFANPEGITTDGTNLYVADSWNNTIRKIVIATGAVTTLAGSPYEGPGSADGIGSAARFQGPRGITTDGTNLYVADTFNKTIRKIVIATGAVTTLAGSASDFPGFTDGIGPAARFNVPYGITTDGVNLYVADSYNHTIRKIVIATSAVTTLAGSAPSEGFTDGTGAAARFSLPQGITTDGTNLYVADSGNNAIRKIVIATATVTTLAGAASGSSGSADGIGPAARFNGPQGITTDGTNLYVADSGNDTIRKISSADLFITSATSSTPDGSYATGAQINITLNFNKAVTSTGLTITLNAGASITTGLLNNVSAWSGIYTVGAGQISGDLNITSVIGTITDAASNSRIDPPIPAGRNVGDGKNIVVAGGGVCGLSDGRMFTSAPTIDLCTYGVASTPTGSGPWNWTCTGLNGGTTANCSALLAIPGLMGGTIQGGDLNLTATTAVATTPAGSAGSSGSADGIGPTARFYYPDGITTDGTNLYVADSGNNTIRKIVIATGAVTTLAGSATDYSGSADGIGAAARFYSPYGITTDGVNLYVADSYNHTIRKIVIATSAVTTLAGSAETPGFDDGIGPAARFNEPDGITTDGTNLYVADSGNDTIRKIVIATGAVTTLAGSAETPGFDDGIGPAARFRYPGGITTDGTNLYVADSGNDTIRKIVIATGAVTTLAGSATDDSGSADGIGEAARFYFPYGITTDGTNLYVSDMGNNTIRKIVIATSAVTTLAGSATGYSGSADGIGPAARFYDPNGVTTDGMSLYVVDCSNHTIRMIGPPGPAITSATSSTPNGSYLVGAQINITLNFSEPINSTGLTITFNTGAFAATGPLSNVTTWSGIYTIGSGQTTPDLTITSVSGTLTNAASDSTVDPIIPDGQNIGDGKEIVIALNGLCGSSDGRAFVSVPVVGLCSAGTASTPTGAGPWAWTCTGLNGGTTANCSANLLIAPEINLKQGATPIPSGGNYAFGNMVMGNSLVITFTIENTGNEALTLTGSPEAGISGTNAADFVVASQPSSPISAGSTVPLVITFTPGGVGSRTATVTISNNDPDEGTYTFAVTGNAVTFATLPRTGQVKCYDTAGAEIACSDTGQDGETLAGAVWPDPRFIVGTGSQTDCVTDALTGLMWSRNGNPVNGKMNWSDAIDYANGFTLCGYSDWRLPNVNEMESLIHIGRQNMADWLNTQVFSNVQADGYWSSTTCAHDTDQAWFVGLGGAPYTGSHPKAWGDYVWPVRTVQGSFAALTRKTGQTTSYRAGDDGDLEPGVAWPSPRFTDKGDGTVEDRLTGLTWTKDGNAPGPSACSPGSQKTWQAALDYIGCLNSRYYLGYNDWRLPNRKESQSLVDYSRSNPALPAGHPFANIQSENYWSSNTHANGPDSAWYTGMGYGVTNLDVKTNSHYAWPVRGGEVELSYYNLFISKSGTGMGTVTSVPSGIDCGSVCTAPYDDGTSVSLTAVPSDDSLFAGWSGGGCSGTGPCTVTMDGPKNVTAVFDLNPTPYSISGTVRDIGNNQPFQGVTVTVRDGGNNTVATGRTDASGVYTIKLPAGGNYSVAAVKTGFEMYSFPQAVMLDEANKAASLSVIYMESSVTVFAIVLSPGWNFISSPLQPENTAINTVLADISSHIAIVWGFNNETKRWLKWLPGAQNPLLSAFEVGKGYWIYMNTPATLIIHGASSSAPIHLFDGWNLVGHREADGIDIAATISTLNDTWAFMWNWHNSGWTARHAMTQALPVPVLTNLYQGRAYWIKIKPGSAMDWAE